MKNHFNKAYVVVIAFIFVFATLACNASSVTNLFATPTPTPTNTPTITPSPTITPTSTPTETPVPTLTPTPLPTGLNTEKQSDDTVLLTDYDNQYNFVLPANWTVIPLSGKDMEKMLDIFADKNPSMKDTADAFRELDPNIIRVIALNNDAKYFVNGFATNMTVTVLEDKMLSAMPLAFVTGAIEESMKQSGSKVITNDVNIVESANGVEVGVIEAENSITTATGSKVTARSRILLFQSDGKLVMINLTCPKQFMAELSPELDKIAQSVEVSKP